MSNRVVQALYCSQCPDGPQVAAGKVVGLDRVVVLAHAITAGMPADCRTLQERFAKALDGGDQDTIQSARKALNSALTSGGMGHGWERRDSSVPQSRVSPRKIQKFDLGRTSSMGADPSCLPPAHAAIPATESR